MANLSSAHVQSLSALGEFRSAIAQFRSEGMDGIAALTLDVRKARDWLSDRRANWERAVRDCYDEVVRAKSELARRQTVPAGDRVPDTSQQEEDLRKAKARLQYAEDKVERCRRWAGQLERFVEEFEGPVRRLNGRLEIELPRAGATIERLMQRLETYLSTNPATAQSHS